MTQEIDELCRRLLPVAGDRVHELWALYQGENADGRRWVELELRRLAAEQLGVTFQETGPMLEPPPEEICAGDYVLGTATYNGQDRWPFGLREEEWIQHVGVFGRSGSGKTNLCFGVLKALAGHGKPFVIFDWKRNYRDAVSFLPGMVVFSVGRDVSPFRFNPLIVPEGTPPGAWLKKLIEIVASVYFLGEGVKFLLQNAIDAVYREYGVYDGTVTSWPTLADVAARLDKEDPTGRRAEWQASTMRALGAINFGEFGKVVNVREPFPLAGLLQRQVVLELDALTSTDKTFLTEAFLLWLHHHQMAQPGRETFKCAVVIEEAHHLLLRKRQEMTGEETAPDILLREIRELGVGITLLDQHPSLISKPALGNSGTTVCMNLKHADDVRSAGDAMGLFGDDRKALGEIPVGSAVVRLQGRWPRPFTVRFPRVEVKKGSVDDAKLRELMDNAILRGFPGRLECRMLHERMALFLEEAWGFFGPLLEDAGVPGNGPGESPGGPGKGGEEVRKCEGEDGAATGRKKAGEEAERDGGAGGEDAGDGLPQADWELLRDVALRPAEATHERYGRLGLTFYLGNKARDALVERGLVAVVKVKTGKGRVKLFEPTAAGRELLKMRGVTASWRRGGVVHAFWVRRAADTLRQQGWTVEVEKTIGGGAAVDIVAGKEGEELAVEVETGKSEAGHNVKRALAAGFGQVIVLATDKKAAAELVREIAGSPAGRVKVCLAAAWAGIEGAGQEAGAG